MRLLLLTAWRNLGRNRRRTAINLSAIAFATLTMIFMSGMQTGSYNQMIDSAVKMQTGHLQVQAADYLADQNIHLVVRHVDDVLRAIDAEPGVVGAVGRITTGMLVSRGDESFIGLVIGTDPAREAKTSNWRSLVREGAFLDAADPNGALIGKSLADNLSAHVGDGLVIVGQAFDGSIAATKLTVRGIIRTGMPELDRRAVIMNLGPLQTIMAMEGMVNTIPILLESHKLGPRVQPDLETKLRAIDDNLRVRTWQEVSPGLYQGIQMDNVSGKFLVFLLLLVVAFGILNTFLMSAFERFREFGVLMAVGMRARTCGALLLVESQMLVLVGFAIGLTIGSALTLYFGAVGIPLPGAEEYMEQFGMSGSMYPVLTAPIVTGAFLQVWIVTLLVALYPAWKITRFRPVEALRHI